MIRTPRRTLLAFLLAASAVAPAALSAQTTVGVLGGGTLSTFAGDDADGAGHDTGLVLGVFGHFPLGAVLTFRPEVTWVEKGATFEDATGEGSLDLSYVEIPVLLRIGVPGVGLGLHALAGPSLAFEVDCQVGLRAGGVDVETPCEEGEASDRKSFLAGFHVGGGIDLPLALMTVSLDARYTFDMESIVDDAEGGDLSHRVWWLTTSFGFPIG